MNAGIFKEYDIRGAYPGEVNEEVFFEIGRTLGKFFRRRGIIAGQQRTIKPPSFLGRKNPKKQENKENPIKLKKLKKLKNQLN